MSKTRKIILSIWVAITMLVALVIGFSIPKANTKGDGAPNIPNINNIDKPKTITYQAGEIEVVGTNQNTINYTYSPSNNAKSTSVKAYEYIFGRPSQVSDTMAVTLQPLEEIDGATISYFYADEPQTFDDTTTVDTAFKAQTINSANTNIYLYVIVSPSDANIPVDFTTNIVWNFGVAGTMTYMVNGTPTTETIVKGQPLPEPETPTTTQEGYYFDAWFYDEDFTQLASFPVETQGQNLYARFANLPSDYLAWDSTTSSYYVKQSYPRELNSDGFYYGSLETNPITNLVIPTLYNDNINGEACVTYVGPTGATDNMILGNLTCFYKCETITLPCSITTLQNQAFGIDDGWESTLTLTLTSIDLNSCINLTTIGDNAFYDCAKLTNITLPKSLTAIGDNAFNGCTVLTSVNFKDLSNLNSIGTGAFTGTAITDIDLSNTKITTVGQSFPTTLQTIKLPSTLETIAEKAFYQYTNLAEVDFSKCINLTTIGASAFDSCGFLTNIDLNNCTNLTTLNNGVFSGCDGLVNVQIDKCSKLTTLGDTVFYSCKNLENITLPDSISTMGGYVFKLCENLTSVIIPSNLETIPVETFNGCTSLTTVNFEDLTNLTTIGNNAFADCKKLKKVDLSNSSQLMTLENEAFLRCESMTEVKLPRNVQTLGNYIFHRCTNLSSINLGDCDSLVSIGIEAFVYCVNLTNITFPQNLESIGQSSFAYSGIVSVDASSLTKLAMVGNAAFGYCDSLTTVVLPSSITTLGYSVFTNCGELIRVDLSRCNKLEVIDNRMFENCVKLSEVKLSTSVTVLGLYVFYNCTSLNNLFIPASVNKIGGSAFSLCSSLTQISFEETSTWYSVDNITDWDNVNTSATSATIVEDLTTVVNKTGDNGLYYFRVG